MVACNISLTLLLPLSPESLSQEMAGVNIKAEGDLSSLDLRSRISLAMLLDIPKDNQDWRYILHVHLAYMIICGRDNFCILVLCENFSQKGFRDAHTRLFAQR